MRQTHLPGRMRWRTSLSGRTFGVAAADFAIRHTYSRRGQARRGHDSMTPLMQARDKVRRPTLQLVVLVLVAVQFTMTACIPLIIVEQSMNRKNDGRTGPIPIESELQIADGLEVYRTSDRESFRDALAFTNGGDNTVPFGDYFLARLSIELKDKNISELRLKNSEFRCIYENFVAVEQICNFHGTIYYKLDGSSRQKKFFIFKNRVENIHISLSHSR